MTLGQRGRPCDTNMDKNTFRNIVLRRLYFNLPYIWYLYFSHIHIYIIFQLTTDKSHVRNLKIHAMQLVIATSTCSVSVITNTNTFQEKNSLTACFGWGKKDVWKTQNQLILRLISLSWWYTMLQFFTATPKRKRHYHIILFIIIFGTEKESSSVICLYNEK